MKLAILSDIHANLEALQATLDRISVQGVDRIVCLGDIVGYNTNPAECIALLRKFDPLCIAGNHDRAVSGQITTNGFSEIAARAVAWTRPRLAADALAFLGGLPLQASIDGQLVLVHGALHPETGCELIPLDNDERRRLSFRALMAHASGAHICAFGHTHHFGIFELRGGVVRAHTDDQVSLLGDAYYLINPGTVGQPRTADRRATYLILDLARRTAAVQRVEYDISRTLAKTRKAGLLPPFSFLPIPIRNLLTYGVRVLGLYDFLKRRMG